MYGLPNVSEEPSISLLTLSRIMLHALCEMKTQDVADGHVMAKSDLLPLLLCRHDFLCAAPNSSDVCPPL